MSARGYWIVALGALLAGLIAFNVFRGRQQASTHAEHANAPAGASEAAPAHEHVATPRSAEEPSATSPGSPADAAGAGGRDVTANAQSATVPASPAPHGSISQVLTDAGREEFVNEELLGADRAFAAESRDATWSTAAEASVLGRIAAMPNLALVSLNVECRTTLCLLQFVTPQTPAPGSPDTGTIVRAAGLRSLYLMAVRDRSGAPVSLAYLQREPAPVSPDVPPAR